MEDLTDQNFEKEISSAKKIVLVDFYSSWCNPCSILSPILEKIAEDYKEKIILTKVNLDYVPLTAQKYGITKIPTVILFKDGKPVSGFVGVRPESAIREWLEKSQKLFKKKKEKIVLRSTQHNPEQSRRIEEMIKNYQSYAQKSGFRLNPDRKVVEMLIEGLFENEKKYGAKYCPCRRITGNLEEDKGKICPCQECREEVEKDGHCHCSLFVK